MMQQELLIEEVVRTVEREVGRVTPAARIAIERAVYAVADEAESARVEPGWPAGRR